MKPVAYLNLRSYLRSDQLQARQIWGMLYPSFIEAQGDFKTLPLFHARSVQDLDSFLCDLRSFEMILQRHHIERGGQVPCVFYWRVGSGGFTDVSMCDNLLMTHMIEVQKGVKIEISEIPDRK